MISPIYPGNGTPIGYTPVVHYFTKVWVKMGYDVRVIHTSAYYPCFYYWAPKWMRNVLENIEGFTLPDVPINNEGAYEIDGVKVYRIPMKKNKPHGKFSDKTLSIAFEKCKEYLRCEKFSPDMIVGHWINPTAWMLYEFKRFFSCPSTIVIHDFESAFNLYPNAKVLRESIDIWGFRSQIIEKNHEKINGIPQYSFRCFSGTPSELEEIDNQRQWDNVSKFIFVGQLIKRKHPEVIVKTLAKVFVDAQYKLTIVGEGAMWNSLQKLTKETNCKDKVFFTGRIKRSQIFDHLDKSDVFIMISEMETFGLVYLEAMSRGCITVAAKKEGMEGIIIDGYNGFLCEAGNEKELHEIINKIRHLSPQKLKEISENGKKTALSLSDKNVAKDYIETILCYGEKIKKREISKRLKHNYLEEVLNQYQNSPSIE